MSVLPVHPLSQDLEPKRKGLAATAGLESVERAMTRLAVGDHLERTGAMVQEHLASGGKRVRARLALTACQALGVPEKDAIVWAAAVEVLHNATLVHDDIQDGDWMRRGQPTTWVRYGMPQAINAGDLMLMLPTVALDELGCDEAVKYRLARAIAVRSAGTVRGQCQEMDLLPSGHLDWKAYLRATEGKTGQLLALPVEGALLLAGRSAAAARAVGDELVKLGVLFQLQDDTRDIFAEKGRGERGSDLYEGKVSALVVEHLALHPEHWDWMCDLLGTPREQTAEADVRLAIERFRDGGALQGVLARIDALSQEIAQSPVLLAEPAVHALATELVLWIHHRVSADADATP